MGEYADFPVDDLNLDFNIPDDSGSATDFGGWGFQGEQEGDAEMEGQGAAGAGGFLQGFSDLWGSVRGAVGEVITGYTKGGFTGGGSALLPYVTGQKKGSIPSGGVRKRIAPPLDTSIPITLGGNMADYDDPGTDLAQARQGYTLAWLCRGSGLSAKSCAAWIKKFGLAVVPYLANYLGTDPSTLISMYFKYGGRGRRRKGLSYRQISGARRVYKVIGKMYHALHAGHRSGPASSKSKHR